MNRDTVDASKSCVELNDTDIPGAHLDEPLTQCHCFTLVATLSRYKTSSFPAKTSDHSEVNANTASVD